jgi:coproporphyrinogen III oxidase
MDKLSIATEFRNLQEYICHSLEKVDGKSRFNEDVWERAEGGGGRTRTISNGGVIEKGGVAFSEVFGPVNDVMKRQLGLDGDNFFATGVSIVLHPSNPHVPIIHMNVRYFELDSGECWFGGGIDLTPHYIVPSQAVQFHQGLKTICDRYDSAFYSKFQPWADEYFYIPHREETRGIGGIFFDHLKPESGLTKDHLLAFCIDLGRSFPELYAQQVIQGKDLPVTEEQIRWRNLRRGRYVEFNLVNDRGTKFGLLSGGRTESILMSLPPDASWEYCTDIKNGSIESGTLKLLTKGIDWASMEQ